MLDLSEKQLENIAQRAFMVFAWKEGMQLPKNTDGSLPNNILRNAAYLGFESGFLKRYPRGIDIGTFGIIREEWLNYWIGFNYGQEEREKCGFIYGL